MLLNRSVERYQIVTQKFATPILQSGRGTKIASGLSTREIKEIRGFNGDQHIITYTANL